MMSPPDPHPNCRCSLSFHVAANAIAKGYDPGEPRDDHGRWGTGGAAVKAKIKAFLDGPGKDALAVVAHKLDQNKKELLAGAITFSLYHIVGADFPVDVESAVHDQVVNFADNAKVSVGMARDYMHQTVDKMIALRGLHKAEPDEVLAALIKLRSVLADMVVTVN
jgi:hypothetical protein